MSTYWIDGKRWSIGHISVHWLIEHWWSVQHDNILFLSSELVRQIIIVAVAVATVVSRTGEWPLSIQMSFRTAASVSNRSSPRALMVGIVVLPFVVWIEVLALVVRVWIHVAIAIAIEIAIAVIGVFVVLIVILIPASVESIAVVVALVPTVVILIVVILIVVIVALIPTVVVLVAVIAVAIAIAVAVAVAVGLEASVHVGSGTLRDKGIVLCHLCCGFPAKLLIWTTTDSGVISCKDAHSVVLPKAGFRPWRCFVRYSRFQTD